MSEMIAFVALVISIVAVATLTACRDEIRRHANRLNDLARQIDRLQRQSGREVEETPGPALTGVAEKPVPTPLVMPEPRYETPIPPPADVPAPPAPKEVPVAPTTEASHAVAEPQILATAPRPEAPRPQPVEAPKSLFDRLDRERWANWEVKLGKQWMTWVGAVVLFLSVGFFVKYAFEHKWLGETARVILGVIAGLSALGVGERFIRRQMRALDVLAFIGTWTLFIGWYFTFRHAPTYSTVPTILWLATFYVVFLIQPFVYHLRLATPIVGERFFLAVSNAAGMLALAYTILHTEHQHVLGLITLGMSASYLVLGSLTRKRLHGDERAVFGFMALSVLFLTIAIPIHLDFDGVTVAWAAEAPVLLYLAYKYAYFPVRAGVLVILALAAGRIFTIH